MACRGFMLMPGLRVDLMGYLFGDLLAISEIEMLWIYLGGVEWQSIVRRCLCAQHHFYGVD
ncbi:hypothetical protein NKDENANG_00487 [Candidatus Entotheonellaceae bacterium PAL068K]